MDSIQGLFVQRAADLISASKDEKSRQVHVSDHTTEASHTAVEWVKEQLRLRIGVVSAGQAALLRQHQGLAESAGAVGGEMALRSDEGASSELSLKLEELQKHVERLQKVSVTKEGIKEAIVLHLEKAEAAAAAKNSQLQAVAGKLAEDLKMTKAQAASTQGAVNNLKRSFDSSRKELETGTSGNEAKLSSKSTQIAQQGQKLNNLEGKLKVLLEEFSTFRKEGAGNFVSSSAGISDVSEEVRRLQEAVERHHSFLYKASHLSLPLPSFTSSIGADATSTGDTVQTALSRQIRKVSARSVCLATQKNDSLSGNRLEDRK